MKSLAALATVALCVCATAARADLSLSIDTRVPTGSGPYVDHHVSGPANLSLDGSSVSATANGASLSYQSVTELSQGLIDKATDPSFFGQAASRATHTFVTQGGTALLNFDGFFAGSFNNASAASFDVSLKDAGNTLYDFSSQTLLSGSGGDPNITVARGSKSFQLASGSYEVVVSTFRGYVDGELGNFSGPLKLGVSLGVSPVPEPATWLGMGLGLLAIGVVCRRRK